MKEPLKRAREIIKQLEKELAGAQRHITMLTKGRAARIKRYEQQRKLIGALSRRVKVRESQLAIEKRKAAECRSRNVRLIDQLKRLELARAGE